MLQFDEPTHTYTYNGRKLISVTQFLGQFFETFTSDHPNWSEKLATGDLAFIREWQKENIHQFGRQYLPEELCQKVSGKSLSEKPYMDYLTKKYTALYHL